ncbi:hypothetical protein WME89_26515 [Sorangium sp. So ce321]|uniref:esterase/lipase family protein n=1 Tax=Sorangium sp. So ce321 TaxID=3133300 RepID=UPI003F5E341A
MLQIYLVPGFMGFQSLGDFAYFRRVPEMLTRFLRELGHDDVEVHECPTLPSGSIARRAQKALELIAKRGGEQASSIHLVGHSTGGLDARLLAAPGVRLIPGDIEERIGQRIRSVVTISTPHYGAPLANLLVALPFGRLLEAIGLLASKERARGAIVAFARFIEKVARVDDWMGRNDTFLDSLVRKLLKRLGEDADDPMWSFLHEMSQDQGASIQLTRESMHLFNAAVADRQGTSYSSLITIAPPPPSFPRVELVSPAEAAARFAFWVLYRIAASESKQYPYTALDIDTLNLDERSTTIKITKKSNDGLVPCQSQAYGKVLDVLLGDHLDVVGQFPNAGGDRHADWLPCGGDFNEERFCLAWSLVAREISANAQAKRQPARPAPVLEAPIRAAARQARARKAAAPKNGSQRSRGGVGVS